MISLNRHIFYGASKNYGSDILDISKKEILTFFPLFFLIIILGFVPNLLLDLFDNSSNYLINIMENLNWIRSVNIINEYFFVDYRFIQFFF